MADLRGKKVSSLSAVHSVFSDDAFLISEPDFLHQRNPHHYTSKSLAFEKLKAKVLADLSNAYEFGSMAYEDENGYSLIGHNHNSIYNKAQISSAYSSSANDLVHVADVLIDRNQTALYVKKPKSVLIDLPIAGEIKLSLAPMQPIVPTALDFDGWVYPDGSRYKLSDFAEKSLSDVFENDGTYFTVPVLNNFIRFNSTPYISVDCSQKEGSDVVPRHNHLVDINLKGTAKGTLCHWVSGNGEGPYSHGHISNKNDYITTQKVAVTLSGLSIADTSKDYIQSNVPSPGSDKTHPTYNNVAVMIYIGKRKGQQ